MFFSVTLRVSKFDVFSLVLLKKNEQEKKEMDQNKKVKIIMFIIRD